tara:strand:+ start:269 stop:1153 length:885 start_codon:yes stop_codon:yes gene_type:complete
MNAMVNLYNTVDFNNSSCVIVSYNPDESLVDNLRSHLALFKKIIIVDNNSDSKNFDLVESFSNDYDQIDIIKFGKNNGIGYALNRGIEGLKDSNEWICLFDQDSCPPWNLFDAYNTVIRSTEIKNEIGLIGVGFSSNPHEFSRFNFINSLSIITSGSVISTKNIAKTGLFNESYFIDSVDFEFNLRLAKLGFGTYLIEQDLLKHSLGNQLCIKWFGIEICSTNHNATRRYYMSRNHVTVSLKYFNSFPLWVVKKNVFYLESLVKILLVETNRLAKFKSCARGLINGYKLYNKRK